MPKNPPDTFHIIMPVSQIPEKSTVRKKNGEAEFTIVDKIRFYGYLEVKPKLPEIPAPKGHRFLVEATRDHAGNISIVSNKTEMVWIADREELEFFLNPPASPEPSPAST